MSKVTTRTHDIYVLQPAPTLKRSELSRDAQTNPTNVRLTQNKTFSSNSTMHGVRSECCTVWGKKASRTTTIVQINRLKLVCIVDVRVSRCIRSNVTLKHSRTHTHTHIQTPANSKNQKGKDGMEYIRLVWFSLVGQRAPKLYRRSPREVSPRDKVDRMENRMKRDGNTG